MVNITQMPVLIFDWRSTRLKAHLMYPQPCPRDKEMRDLAIGKTMEAQRNSKYRERKAISPLLVCWLIAVGLMMLVSRHEGDASRPSTPNASPNSSLTTPAR